MRNKIIFSLILIFVGMQFFRIDTTNPKVEPFNDFISINNCSSEITGILKAACYDCHSNETSYPWYSQIAPVSWWLKDHINDGRKHLNFSNWGEYSSKKADHKLDECVEEIEEGEMPLNSYTWTHRNAKLSSDQKEQLMSYFTSLRTFESEED